LNLFPNLPSSVEEGGARRRRMKASRSDVPSPIPLLGGVAPQGRGGCAEHRSPYRNSVFPPIYPLSTSGICTLPSALKLFSRNAISILGGAATVLLSVCAK